MQPRELAAYERTLGFPCPHRELDPENEDSLEMARHLMSEELRPLAAWKLDRIGERCTSEEQEEIVDRAVYAMQHAEVLKLRFPKPKEKG